MAQRSKRQTVHKKKSTTRSKTPKHAKSTRDDHTINTIHPYKYDEMWVFDILKDSPTSRWSKALTP